MIYLFRKFFHIVFLLSCLVFLLAIGGPFIFVILFGAAVFSLITGFIARRHQLKQ